jgi:hypothetical protein
VRYLGSFPLLKGLAFMGHGMWWDRHQSLQQSTRVRFGIPGTRAWVSMFPTGSPSVDLHYGALIAVPVELFIFRSIFFS